MDREKFYIWAYMLESQSDKFINPPEPIGSMTAVERGHIDRAISAFKSGQTVVFVEHLHKNHWKYFNEHTKGIEGKIELWEPLPKDWEVDGKKKITAHNPDFYQEVVEILGKRNQFKFQSKRQIQNLDKDFLMTYGNREHERELTTQVLERLNVLDNSIYSRPEIDPHQQENLNIDYIFPIRNDHARYRNIEGTDQVLSFKYLHDQSRSLRALYDASKRVHCWVVLGEFPFVKDITPNLSEKFLWPIFFGIPWIYLGPPSQIGLLRDYGFEPNDTYRYDVRSAAEQMMWLKSIFRDPILAQQWQDSQGELINKNLKALENLPDKMLEFKNNPA